jgi:hypothetical protein
VSAAPPRGADAARHAQAQEIAVTTVRLRREIKKTVDELSPDGLIAAAHYVRYLRDRGPDEATQELLEMPGFVRAFEHGLKDIAAGRTTPIAKLKRRY